MSTGGGAGDRPQERIPKPIPLTSDTVLLSCVQDAAGAVRYLAVAQNGASGRRANHGHIDEIIVTAMTYRAHNACCTETQSL